MKRKVITLAVIILAAGLLLAYAFDLFDTSSPASYQEFRSALGNGLITEAEFTDGKIKYTADGTLYSVTDPESPALKEELLLSGAEVKTSDGDINAVGDAIFNIFFLSLMGFGGYKLISWYTNTFRVVKHTGVHFDDVAGLEDLKKEISFRVKLMKEGKSGIRDSRGIILEGPPGNGKTLFARALAEECGVSFIATKGADFQGALMGLGAFKVKMLFSKARRKKPCIVFIDEFDSIGEKRSYAGSGIDKENNRLITTLLNEMDGFTKSTGVLVIAATNSYQSLDAALVRPGRFDLKYTISNPDADARRELIALYTKNMHLDQSLTPDMLVKAFDGLSSAAIESILNTASAIALQNNLTSIDARVINASALRAREKLRK
ncbi:MAG: ATP-binding protein [Bullifex sp.]